MPRKSARSDHPVEAALAGFEVLLKDWPGTQTAFPSERELARRWELSQAAVNRAAGRLVATGRLRRQGYKLFPVATDEASVAGLRVAVLTHRAWRFTGLPAEAALRGVTLEERFYVGRDTLRRELRAAARDRFDGVLFRLSDGGWEWDAEVAELESRRQSHVVCEEAPEVHSMVAEGWREATARLVSHLVAEGHEHLMFFGSLRRAHRSVVVRQAYEETCLRLGLTTAARQINEVAAHTAESVRASVRRMREGAAQTTALVLFDVDLLEAVSAALRAEALRIPEDISLVAVGDGAAARAHQPPVTCVGFDLRTLGHLAFDLLCRQMLHVRRTGRAAPKMRVHLEGVLQARGSVRGLPRAAVVAASVGEAASPMTNLVSRAWSQERDRRLREAAETWLQPHELVAGARVGDFAPLDLRGLANRALSRQNGWLGHLPLLHLPAGRRPIHGVPFEVIDERANGGRAAVVLRAQRGAGRAEEAAPLRIEIPVGRKVRAVYFLHACGFSGERTPFAWYDFQLAGRRPVSLPLIARGLAAPEAGEEEANIQDWWNDFPQFNAPHVRHAVVTQDGDPFDYERYLYTLEWVNPTPGAVLESIRVSGNPAQPAVLGLLGITLLLAAP